MRALKLMLLSVLAAALLPCCTMAERTVVQAAEVVNAVARTGDELDAVAVASCHRAELVAAELPELREAERAVATIRARCDEAFEAIDHLEQAVTQVDHVFSAVERGEATLDELAAAAVASRQAFDDAERVHHALKLYLEEL